MRKTLANLTFSLMMAAFIPTAQADGSATQIMSPQGKQTCVAIPWDDPTGAHYFIAMARVRNDLDLAFIMTIYQGEFASEEEGDKQLRKATNACVDWLIKLRKEHKRLTGRK